MRQETLQQKSAEGSRFIDTKRQEAAKLQEKFAQIRDIKDRIAARQAPAIDYASKLLLLSPNSDFKDGGWYDKFRESPAIKVGELEDGKSVYVVAKQIFICTSKDGEGYPTGKSHEFNRWEYVAAVGEPIDPDLDVSRRERRAEGDSIGYVGTTMSGEDVRGIIISEERVHPASKTDFYEKVSDAEAALKRTDKHMDSVDETVALIRAGLANEEWNPRDGLSGWGARTLTESLV